MKKFFTLMLLVLFACSTVSYAQKDDSNKEAKKNAKEYKVFDETKYAFKLNGTTLLGLVNPAMEFKVHDYLTIQLDLFGSFYNKTFWTKKHYPLMMGAGWAEFRYYPVEAFHGFYIGAHLGGSYYKLNYNVVPLIKKHNYIDDRAYQIGYNLMLGYTIGYAFTFKSNPHWGFEISLGGGGHFDKYYHVNNPDKVPAKEDRVWMKYKGFIPIYKGGILVVYRW